MENNKEKFLKLFFNEDETICVSHNSYGYHSIGQKDIRDGLFVLESPNVKIKPENVTENEIVLMSINPVNGFRRDENVTAFRSFMVELDDMSLEKQKQYIDEIGLPYSVCVFSGNKSLHFGIVLDEDLPTYEIWRDVAEWILNIVDKADPMTKNPTRSIRFPDNIRPDGKRLKQKLVEIKGRVSVEDLSIFLNRYPEKNPSYIAKINKPRKPPVMIGGIPLWVLNKLEQGVGGEKGRNNEWFGIAMELARNGMDDMEMMSICSPYFTPERDFTQNEWESIFKNAYKRAERM